MLHNLPGDGRAGKRMMVHSSSFGSWRSRLLVGFYSSRLPIPWVFYRTAVKQFDRMPEALANY
jgi:hypothetical protein